MDDFNKNTHTCGRSAIAIDETDLTRIILLTHYLFYWENSQERKMIPYENLQWEKLTFFFLFGGHSDCIAQFLMLSSGFVVIQKRL